MERIILMRHTDAKGGDGDIYRGQTDLDLTPRGFRHAKRIAERLKKLHIDKIYSSVLKRAIHTAEPIAEAHNLKLKKSRKINEMSFGIFDGLKVKEVMKKYPDLYKARGKDKMNFRIPGGGENFNDVRKRALSFILGEAKKSRNKTLMFVTHASLMKSVLIDVMKNKSGEEISNMLDYGCRVYLKHNGGKLHFEKVERD